MKILNVFLMWLQVYTVHPLSITCPLLKSILCEFVWLPISKYRCQIIIIRVLDYLFKVHVMQAFSFDVCKCT